MLGLVSYCESSEGSNTSPGGKSSNGVAYGFTLVPRSDLGKPSADGPLN